MVVVFVGATWCLAQLLHVQAWITGGVELIQIDFFCSSMLYFDVGLIVGLIVGLMCDPIRS